MAWTKRTILGSLFVGIIGALLNGLVAVPIMDWDIGSGLSYYTSAETIMGVILGFLACFCVSMWYLKFMDRRKWTASFGFGVLFGMLAGAVSLVGLAIFSQIFAVNRLGYDPTGGDWVSGIPISGVYGAVIGLIVGMLLTVILRSLFKSHTNTPVTIKGKGNN
jgi:hypothetical protein